ncbi:hypothetical protein DB347_12255 [Opitutaceae bacterium EW11]|nr:hypothetical protein DB347_12255 [Opitutaceae bacterium EW11]
MNPPGTETPAFYAGIDGGGSSTRVLIASEDGSVAGQGHAGPCNPNSVGIQAAAGAVAEAFAAAWNATGFSHTAGRSAHPGANRIAAAFFGIAGFTAFPHRAELQHQLGSLPWLAGARVEVDNDLRIAWAGALGGNPGVVVIAGTGSAAYGRTHDGRSDRCGGGGPLLDDGGSGAWLAAQALRAALRESDGRGPTTALTAAALSFFHAETVLEIAGRVASGAIDRAALARFAATVLNQAEAGDTEAQRIAQAGAEQLAELADAVRRKLLPEGPLAVSLTGGLSSVSSYTKRFQQAAGNRMPGAKFLPARYSPLAGAIALAAHLGGARHPRALIDAADRLAPLGTG